MERTGLGLDPGPGLQQSNLVWSFFLCLCFSLVGFIYEWAFFPLRGVVVGRGFLFGGLRLLYAPFLYLFLFAFCFFVFASLNELVYRCS